MLIYIIGVGVIVILIIRKANSDVDQVPSTITSLPHMNIFLKILYSIFYKGSIDVSHQLRGVYVSPAVKSSLNSVDQDADSNSIGKFSKFYLYFNIRLIFPCLSTTIKQ